MSSSRTIYRLRQGLLSAALVLSPAVCAQGQTTDPVLQQLQAQRDRLQAEADIAKAQQTKAEAEAAAFKAQLGGITTANLPQGTIKTDNVVIEASYLAYMAANSAARVIASQIPCGANVVFFSSKDLDAIQALNALKAQIPLVTGDTTELLKPLKLKRVSTSVLPEPVGDVGDLYIFVAPSPVTGFVSPAMISAGIDTGLSLISLFKTDTEFHGVVVSADDLALQAQVAQQWHTRCGANKIIHPGYAYPPIKGSSDLLKTLNIFSQGISEVSLKSQELIDKVQTPLAKAVDGLRKVIADQHDTNLLIASLKARLKDPSTPAQKKKIQADLDKATKHLDDLDETIRTNFDSKQPLPAPKKHYEEKELTDLLADYVTDQLRADVRIQLLKALQPRMTDVFAALTKSDSNGITPLVPMLRAQALSDAIGDGARLLQVGFVTAGGNNIIKKNAIFSTLRFSGGVVAKFLLVDNGGFLIASGVVACYGGQLKEGDIGKTFREKKGAMACTEDIPKDETPKDETPKEDTPKEDTPKKDIPK